VVSVRKEGKNSNFPVVENTSPAARKDPEAENANFAGSGGGLYESKLALFLACLHYIIVL
jgi:hypothetical protein